MRIAITQPNFLPWLGYFELLDHVDHFVALDDTQLVRGTFLVRNRVRSASGATRWLTLAVQRCSHRTPLNEAIASRNRPWWDDALRSLDTAYETAPHWPWVRDWLADALPPRANESVASYNLRLLRDLSKMTGCGPSRWHRASKLLAPEPGANIEDRLVAMCRQLDGTSFCNARKGIDIGLHKPAFFAEHGLALWRQAYEHPRYGQGDWDFVDRLSVLDAMAHCGPDAIADAIRGGRRWAKVPVANAA